MAAEQRRAAVSSIAAVAARHVDDLAELHAEDLPEPLRRLGAPPGWRLANLAGSPVQPARVAVYGQHPDGSWDGCETIRAFGFTGALPADVVRDNADRTLRDLNAENITAGALAAPPPPAATAVRSSGYCTIAGRPVWAQFSSYVAGPTPAARGLLIEHSLVIDSGCRARFDDDITHLSNAIHHAFLTAIEHTIGTVGTAKPGFAQFRYDATGLRGKRLRLLTDMPTNDAGDPQDLPEGITDVIAVDDTPSVMLSVRVHPPDDPDRIAIVAVDQLALYQDQ
jgi:hypothetical protein